LSHRQKSKERKVPSISSVKKGILDVESRPLSPITRIATTYPAKKIDQEKKGFPELDPYDLESATIDKQLTCEQRYWYYVLHGLKDDTVAPIDEPRIYSILLSLTKRDMKESFKKELINEIKGFWNLSLKQSVLDYVLLDSSEQKRLGITPFIDYYVPKIARAPVPWHGEFLKNKAFIVENLYISNPIMLQLLGLFSTIEKTKIIDPEALSPSILPMSTEDVTTILRNQCATFRAKILNE
jgi:dynein heavy chain